MPWPIREIAEHGESVFVLLDPDAYLAARGRDAQPLRNLRAFRRNGEAIWEAELPEAADYFYQIVSASPLLVANSASSFRCVIDHDTGLILHRTFYK